MFDFQTRLDHKKNSAYYQTKAQREHTTAIGIPSYEADPMLPIAALVRTGPYSYIDWTKNSLPVITKYERESLKNKKLTFDKNLPAALAIENLKFPECIPARLAYNCSHESTCTFTIHGFPVKAMFHSCCTSFEKNYEKAMTLFYKNPDVYLSDENKEELVSSGILTKSSNPRCNPYFCLCPKFTYAQGIKGCTSIEQSMIAGKTNKKSVFEYLMGRQIGQLPPYKSAKTNTDGKINSPLNHHYYLEHICYPGKKSPTQKPIHYSKNSPLDIDNKPNNFEQDIDLDFILDCITKLAAQKQITECSLF